MSWKASAWAKQQRLGSPAAKAVLMCLADYADPSGLINGWASQEQLAEDAEITDRAVRGFLQTLESWGLMSRRRRSGAGGARATDVIQLNLDVMVLDGKQRLKQGKGCAPAGAESLPENASGRTNRNEDASLPEADDSPTGTEFRAYKEEPPLSDQSPPIERDARASGQEEGQPEAPATDDQPAQSREQLERRFWKLARNHPQSAGMPKKPWLEAWLKLEPAEQDRAERRYPAWLALLKAQSKNHVPALSTYFAEKLFDEVPEPADEADKPAVVEARPFGPLWAALVMRELLGEPQPAPAPSSRFLADLVARDNDAGRAERLRRQAVYGWPTVNRWFSSADSRKGFAARPEEQPLAELTEPVPVDSKQMAAWKAEFDRRGWPWLPDWGGMRVVYLPKGGPQGLSDFQEALARIEAGTGEGQQEAAE